MKKCKLCLVFIVLIGLLSGCGYFGNLVSFLPDATDEHLPSRLIVQIDIKQYPDQPGANRRYTTRENVESIISILRRMEDGDVPESDTNSAYEGYSYYTISTTGANGSTQTYYLINRRLFRNSEGIWCTVSEQEVAALEEFITTTFTDCVVEDRS